MFINKKKNRNKKYNAPDTYTLSIIVSTLHVLYKDMLMLENWKLKF